MQPVLGHSFKFAQTEAEDIAAKDTGLAQQLNTDNGFSGILFENSDTRRFTTSFHPIEFAQDALADHVGAKQGIPRPTLDAAPKAARCDWLRGQIGADDIHGGWISI